MLHVPDPTDGEVRFVRWQLDDETRLALGVLAVESPIVPPGHLYLIGPNSPGPVLYAPAPPPWWRRALVWVGHWVLEALAAAGSVWIMPHD